MKNKYIFVGGDEYYHFGKIIDLVNDCILVQLLSVGDDIPTHSRLYHLECLAHSDDCFFFENKKELDDWLKWLETPSATNAKFKVLNFKKDN